MEFGVGAISIVLPPGFNYCCVLLYQDTSHVLEDSRVLSGPYRSWLWLLWGAVKSSAAKDQKIPNLRNLHLRTLWHYLCSRGCQLRLFEYRRGIEWGQQKRGRTGEQHLFECLGIFPSLAGFPSFSEVGLSVFYSSFYFSASFLFPPPPMYFMSSKYYDASDHFVSHSTALLSFDDCFQGESCCATGFTM